MSPLSSQGAAEGTTCKPADKWWEQHGPEHGCRNQRDAQPLQSYQLEKKTCWTRMNAVFFLICLLNDHCHSKIAVTAVTGPPLETHGDSPKMNAETWQGSPTVRGWLDSCQYAHAVVMCPLLNVSFSSILPTCFLAQVCVCVIPCLSCLVNQVSRAENFPTLHVQKWSCTPKMTSTLTANPHFSWARDKPTSQIVCRLG